MYKFGAIVLVPFPFTDLTSTKVRPALVISKTHKEDKDVVVAFITSKMKPGKSTMASFEIKTEMPSFPQTGLKVNSYVHFNKIATLHKKLILGELGNFSTATLKKMARIFKSTFGF